jgi:hypothetical protein
VSSAVNALGEVIIRVFFVGFDILTDVERGELAVWIFALSVIADEA